jgi:hypothetical protein
MKSRPRRARTPETSVYASKRSPELRSAALPVAVLVFFVLVLGLPALLRLAGLTALLALSRLAALLTMLSGLSALLALSGLANLLILFLHVVCHKRFLLRKRGPSHASEILGHM